MGFFGLYLYAGGRWSEVGPDEEPTPQEPWLAVSIHDSDFATVAYAPPGSGSGAAFLGYTPRTYFEDETASEPTDPDREARGLAAWWATLHPEANELARDAKAGELRAFLAADIPPGEEADNEDDADDANLDDADDADAFVELKAALFIRALGLPVPVGLPE